MHNHPMSVLIGHRGLPTLAPENTKSSIVAAAKNGIQWIEIDVTMAGDDSLVIMHDADLKLFGQPKVRLVDINRIDLTSIDAGSWFDEKFAGEPILFLDDLLSLVKDYDLSLNLEIKINPDIDTLKQVTAVYDTLQKNLPPQNCLIVSSFNHEALSQLRQLSATVQIGVLFDTLPDNLLNDVIHLLPTSIHCEQSKLTQEQARHIVPHYPLYCFTVNDTLTLEKLLSWGIAGVFCDRAHAQNMIQATNKA